MKNLLTFLIVPIVLFSACGNNNSGQQSNKASDYVFVAMDGGDEHFIKANEGIQAKAKELGVTVDFQAPSTKADLDAQARLVEDAIARKVKGIILAALDPFALAPVVQRAVDAGIPVVYLDSGTTVEDYVAYAATDNELAAGAAAHELARLLKGKGKVAMVHPVAGLATITARENGFKKAMKEYPGIKIVAELYGQGGDPAVAMNQAQDIITKNPDLNGLFGSNTDSAEGLLRALEERNRTNPNGSKIYLLTFDFSQNLAKGIEKGVIDATIIQNPRRMGELSIESLVNHVNGIPTNPKKVDTGYILVNKQNLLDNISESQLAK